MTDESAIQIAEALESIAEAIRELNSNLPINSEGGRSALVLHCECFHTFEHTLHTTAHVTTPADD